VSEAAKWHELKETEKAVRNAKGGSTKGFPELVAKMVRLRKQLGLPLGI